VDPRHPAWLAHERAGRGEPLVLVHGLGSRRGIFAPLVPGLRAHRDVVALDLPGFGDSPPEPGCAGVAALADRVAAFLAAAGIARPHLAGSSLGGSVALELGRRGAARSVVAFAPAGFFGTPGRIWCRGLLRCARALARGLGPVGPRLAADPRLGPVLCGAFVAHPSRRPAGEWAADVRALAGSVGFDAACAALAPWPPAAARDIGGLTAIPVTVAWGTRDLVLPRPAQARRARALLPSARHVTLPGCGHLPFADDPGACVSLLLDPAAPRRV
jgi:pimeloyl-ACP methyl ester carboxylesterase